MPSHTCTTPSNATYDLQMYLVTTELLLKCDKVLRRLDLKLPCDIPHNLVFLLSVFEFNGLVYYLHEPEVISLETCTYIFGIWLQIWTLQDVKQKANTLGCSGRCCCAVNITLILNIAPPLGFLKNWCSENWIQLPNVVYEKPQGGVGPTVFKIIMILKGTYRRGRTSLYVTQV